MGNNLVARVVVDQAVYRMDKPYDYILPDFCNNAQVGCRVLVPFGKGLGTRQGLIVEILDSSEYDADKLKSIVSVIDEQPILNDEMLSLAKFLKKRTFCTYFDAIKILLPAGISLKTIVSYGFNPSADIQEKLSEEESKIIDYLKNNNGYHDRDKFLKDLSVPITSNLPEKLCKKGYILRNDSAVRKMGDASVRMCELLEFGEDIKLTEKQKIVIDLLKENNSLSVKEICYKTGLTQSVLNTLEKKRVIRFFELESYRKPYNYSKAEKTDITLNDEQKKAYDFLLEEYKKGFSTNLIYGVTGSGKTQVFLKMADEVVEKGKGVIVMVPEIALTPQTISIFNKRYGDRVAVFHSAMSGGQRMDEWKRIKNGDALVAIGTRSAVFAPFDNLGLIIIDEEQEHTYKSEQSPKFHAREVARFRANYNKCMLILASATPSIETFSSANSGKYNLCKLTKRYGNANLPEVVTVDMRNEFFSGNRSIISKYLLESLEETLKSKNQAILLLNRRGYNTFVSCASCGEVVTCPNCSISMTYHSANGRLNCHYCGHSIPYASKCKKCGGEHMKYLGMGTQKVEQELKSLFPDANILRMDADSVMNKSSYEKNLSAFANGEYDIMLGTQMIAKGLDFPKVTLVGILSADQSLYSDDFRSYEKTFSLLTQVVGRSGRGDKKGKAVIQTAHPENEIIKLASEQNYDEFYKTEILNRKIMIYPPYCDISMIVLSSEQRDNASAAAQFIFKTIVELVDGEYSDVKLNILGPSVANIPRVNNKYRYRLIVKFKKFDSFQSLIDRVMQKFYESPFSKNSSVSIDINPESII